MKLSPESKYSIEELNSTLDEAEQMSESKSDFRKLSKIQEVKEGEMTINIRG